MQKVDRLSWSAGASLKAHGVRIGVRVNTDSALHAIESTLTSRWPRSNSAKVDHLFSVIVGGREEGSRLRRYNIVYDGATRILRTLDLDELRRGLEEAIDFKVAQHAEDRVFVHAGAVGWKGRAVVVPGASRSGKTTLIRALVEAGAEYYSDEFAVLDARGRVHPFTRPPRVRQPGGGRGVPVPLGELGGIAGRVPLRIGIILDSPYASGVEWRPKETTPAQGLMSLFANTVVARTRPQQVIPTLSRAIVGASTLKGARGDAQAVARRILDLLDASL